MRIFAEFVMRSRSHAIGVSMVTAVLPVLNWLSLVIVALVVLQLGAANGAIILLWTMLPAGAIFLLLGDPSPAMALIGTFLLAVTLRQTISWEFVLVGAVIYAGGTVLAMQAYLVDSVVALLHQLQSQLLPEVQLEPMALLPIFAVGQAVAMILVVMVARWVQSNLYRPGAFRQEFHQLRLSPAVSAIIVAGIIVCYAFYEQLSGWLQLLTIPLGFAALALVHWILANKDANKRISDNSSPNGWIVGLYIGLVLLFNVLYPLLVSLALVDSWSNIRKLIRNYQKG